MCNRSYILLDYIEFRTQLDLFEIFVSILIHDITLKTVLLKKKTVLRENHINRESKSLEITI